MKQVILRWIYHRFAAKFNDFLVEDYVKDIPADVKHEMDSLYASQKSKLQRANDFLAFKLHRQMATDPRNSERYQGMFIQLKLFDAMLKSKPDVKPTTPAQVSAKEAPFDYEKSIEEALKKGKESNAQSKIDES